MERALRCARQGGDDAERDGSDGMLGATIPVADDEASIVDLVATVLEDEGYTVLRAHDGGAALALLERDGLDLLITDNTMPRLSGLALIRHMQGHPGLMVPTILMSAIAVVESPPPPTVFLRKPFDLNQLLAVVGALLA